MKLVAILEQTFCMYRTTTGAFDSILRHYIRKSMKEKTIMRKMKTVVQSLLHIPEHVVGISNLMTELHNSKGT